MVNNAFREGILDDTYNELIKLIHSKGLVKNKIFQHKIVNNKP